MHDRHRQTAARLVAAVSAVLLLGACSSSSGSSEGGSPNTSAAGASTSATVPAERAEPVDLDGVTLEPVPPGGGIAQASATVPRASAEGDAPVLADGYREAEYLVSGGASSYTGPATGPAVPSTTTTPYTTRILVRQPADASKFSGRVILEPFNTSGEAELDAVWAQLQPMLEASGDAWIGVTDRSSSVAALQAFDPARYADLSIASNDLAWDLLRQVGALAKAGGSAGPLAGLEPEHAYLSGYSQSAIDVATFAMALGPITGTADETVVYDGYLPAAHSGSLTPLKAGTSALPEFEYEPMSAVPVPVIDVETQSDVEGFTADISPGMTYTSHGGGALRRDDSDTATDKYRLYEIAGAPHVSQVPGCDGPGSTFPTPAFLRAAAARLFQWAETGEAPPTADRIDLETEDVVSVAAVDGDGNAEGGVRSPQLDEPLGTYEVHSDPGALCQLSGRTVPFSAAELDDRYGSVDDYLDGFTTSLDAAIEDGTLLAADRSGLLRDARAQASEAFGSN